MKNYVFACTAQPGQGMAEALLLARSIRQFGGSMAGNTIGVLIPETGDEVGQQIEADFRSLAVRLIPFTFSDEAHGFPFAGKVFAAAKAEAWAEGANSNLIWMDRDSLVLQEPFALQLPPGKLLGYRPVDHTLIGSPYDSPLDDFWGLVYRLCAVPAERVFPMIASVDENRIRPYFNAGMLVVRPEHKLLRSWAGNFERLYDAPSFKPFYEQDFLYRIFFHQAILAGTVLTAFDQAQIYPLPYLVNYPLHMHSLYPAAFRPARMNDLISCRYDTFFQDPAWQDESLIDEPLKSWLLEIL